MAHCGRSLRGRRRVVGGSAPAVGCGLPGDEPMRRGRLCGCSQPIRIPGSTSGGPRPDRRLRSPDRLDGVGSLSGRPCGPHSPGLPRSLNDAGSRLASHPLVGNRCPIARVAPCFRGCIVARRPRTAPVRLGFALSDRPPRPGRSRAKKRRRTLRFGRR
jgi:hypothetical protein